MANPKKTSLAGWDLWALAAVFLPACYLYLWKTLQTHLVYAAFGDFVDFPIFTPDRACLVEHLVTLGGPVRYAANFLSQWFYYDAAGALILTALAAAFYAATLALLRVAVNVRSHILAAAPAIAVIALYGDYNHRLPAFLALLVSLAFAAVFVNFRPRNNISAAAAFAAAFALLYWAAAAASLLFALLVALTELLHRKWLTALADIAIAFLAAWLIGTYVFLLEMPIPFTVGLPEFVLGMNFRTAGLLWLWLFFPAAVLLAAAARRILDLRHPTSERPAPARRRSRKDSKKASRVRAWSPLSVWLKTPVAALVIAGAAVFAIRQAYNPDRRQVLLMNHLIHTRQWQAWLEAADTLQRRGLWGIQLNHDANRALYHSGRLLDNMFSFGQKSDALMMMTAEGRFSTKFLRATDLFFEMGDLNDAEHWAYELLESEGPNPLILERLVDINLAKNQPEAASVFLNFLAKDLVHGSRARQRLAALRAGGVVQSDPRIRQAQAMNWQSDVILNHQDGERFLLDLLEQHPDNRMAFEYLMAIYLMMYNQEKVVANLNRLDAFDYKRIPRHLEEAILIYMGKTGKPVNLNGRQISADTKRRYERYLQIFNKAGRNKERAFRLLAPEFGNSYFLYSMFPVSGAPGAGQ